MKDLDDRNNFLYDQLRQHYVIDLLEESFDAPHGLDIELRNPDGDRYHCTLPSPDGDEVRGGDDEEEEGDDGSGGAEADRKRTKRLDAALAALEGQCDVLSMGWWSYEWCHRKHVRQFHVDHAAGTVDPEWSLGSFAHSQELAAGEASADQFPVVDDFAGGQHCDETGSGRSTRVEFRCCEGAADAATAGASAKQGRGKRGKAARGSKQQAAAAVASLASISEPSVCNYEAVICTPLACDYAAAGAATGDERADAGRNASAFELIEPLGALCFSRHEGCVGGGCVY